MASSTWIKLHLMLSLLTLSLPIYAHGSGSILFIDSPKHPYLRRNSLDNEGQISKWIIDRHFALWITHVLVVGILLQTNLMTSSDVAAAISISLGYAPSLSLESFSTSKVDEILLPNPFDRPRAVFALEVRGTEDLSPLIDSIKAQTGIFYHSRTSSELSDAKIELPDDEVIVVSLDDQDMECDAACVEQRLYSLADLVGGSYHGTHEPLKGRLIIPLANDASLTLHMSEKAEQAFVMDLISLVQNVKRAGEIHFDFSHNTIYPAELLLGCFTGIEALQQHYGQGIITKQAMEVLHIVFSKLFDSLQSSFQGHIIATLIIHEKRDPASKPILGLKSSFQDRRWLEEAAPTNVTAIAEVLLVRSSLAWITGVILVISTLIGLYFMFNMPITRDTLLYSNVKLD
ncbi:hypothetical protein AMTRI_Chr07g75460 [Amborella trichopoda]